MVSTVRNGSLRCLLKLFSSLRCLSMKLLDAAVLIKVFKVSSIFLFAAHFLLLLDLVNPKISQIFLIDIP